MRVAERVLLLCEHLLLEFLVGFLLSPTLSVFVAGLGGRFTAERSEEHVESEERTRGS
jgi:hypothetical protein